MFLPFGIFPHLAVHRLNILSFDFSRYLLFSLLFMILAHSGRFVQICVAKLEKKNFFTVPFFLVEQYVEIQSFTSYIIVSSR